MKTGNKVFIIAEAGVNHNGDLYIAKKLVDTAKRAGADAVKFQTFITEELVTGSASKASYQKKNSGSSGGQFTMLKALELGPKEHRIICGYCRKKKIEFLSTPFDLGSIDLLVSLGVKTIKIPSGEITNVPYLRKIGRLKKNIIMSTGMADLKEIKIALRILVNSGTPLKNMVVLHCNTAYPSPMSDVNLKAMDTIRNACGVDVGYSDHTIGIEASIAAVAMGAKVIEKHFTLDIKMRGPDHAASASVEELRVMIRSIRNVEKAMGDGIKRPTGSERPNIRMARKGIVAGCDISKGETLTPDNMATKRPEKAIGAALWNDVIGMIAKTDLKKDQHIRLCDIAQP